MSDILWIIGKVYIFLCLALAILLPLAVLAGCDNNYQPRCLENCSAGGGDDSFGAGARPLPGAV